MYEHNPRNKKKEHVFSGGKGREKVIFGFSILGDIMKINCIEEGHSGWLMFESFTVVCTVIISKLTITCTRAKKK